MDKILGLASSSRPPPKNSTPLYGMLHIYRKEVIMGKLEGKVAVITGGSSGMALASAKRCVEEGAYVFITGRGQEALDEAVKLIGRDVIAAGGSRAKIDDRDAVLQPVNAANGGTATC